ncbi:serine/threonine-protein kinase [Kitasatospora sp. NPDC096147]|uniref:serine/threonine-protein kinase n=1 Tax=Kitasatospora sp. NPDC096147 TaxID=3364093 RepID=UPI003812015B
MPTEPGQLDVPAGYLVAGCRIGPLIGSGAWGRVYAGECEADGTPVAVKFLPPGRLTPGQRRTMAELTRREVRFSRRADHPHLIRTLSVTTIRDPTCPALDGAVVLVMERAELSLQQLLQEAAPGRPLPDVGQMLGQLAAGLAHMHGRGWVHGDLKPGNVLLMPDGGIRLADFGLTTQLEGTHAYAPPLGSLDHVPPEWWSQRSGPRGVQLRPSADVWAFGVLAHQVLTGGLHPFLGATARARALTAQSYARGSTPLRLDERLPEGWRTLISDCLAVDQVLRPTAERLVTRLRLLHSPPPPRRWRRIGLTVTPALLLALLLALPVIGPTEQRTGAAGQSPTAPPPPTATTVSTPAAAPPAAPYSAPYSGPAPAGPSTARSALAGALPPDSDVPTALREPIERAARRCPEPEITPVLIAAMLKAESGFDPRASRPQTEEYGIAMWTPSVFNAWAQDGDGDGRKDYMSAPDAIITMGNYVCWLDQQLKRRGVHGDLPALITAGYRTSDKTVADVGGVPERVRPHVDLVLRYLAQYGG